MLLENHANLTKLRVTMAAIDPSEEVVVDAADRKPRATLKIITIPSDMLDEDDSELDEDEEDDEDDLEANGGPSDKKLSRKIREAMEEDSEEDDEDMDEDDEEDEAEAQKVLAKLMKASKGKAVAGGDEDEDSEEDDDDDMLGGELDECVVCTLDPEKVGCPSPAPHSLLTQSSNINNLSTSPLPVASVSSSRSLALIQST